MNNRNWIDSESLCSRRMFWKGANSVWVVEGLREVGLRRAGNRRLGSVKEPDS